MRKTLFLFVTILFFVPLLSGCFYPYWYDGDGRGYYGHDRGHDRGYDRGYGGQRNGGR